MNKLFLVLFTVALTVSTLNAREVSIDNKISSLYIAFFNRAADLNGMTYWRGEANTAINAGIDISVVLKRLSSGFATHPKFDADYGQLSNEEFVQSIYRNVLGRDGDLDGIAYWTARLDVNSRSNMVSNFVELSLTLDLTPENFPTLTQEQLNAAIRRQDLITNKSNVAVHFTDTLSLATNITETNADLVASDPAYLASIKVLEDVNDDLATATSAMNRIQNIESSYDSIDSINSTWESLDDTTPTVYLPPIPQFPI